MEDVAKAINARVAAVRKYSGLKQKGFADAIGASPSYLSEVENNKGKPAVAMLVGIANRFPEVCARWLLTGEGAMLKGADCEPAGARDQQEDAAGYQVDAGLARVLARVTAWWRTAGEPERAWFEIQLLREFPELSATQEASDEDSSERKGTASRRRSGRPDPPSGGLGPGDSDRRGLAVRDPE